MSGPIVRRYGFPNFDKIFGKKDVEHGVDEPDSPAEAQGEDKAADSAKSESKSKTYSKPEAKPGA